MMIVSLFIFSCPESKFFLTKGLGYGVTLRMKLTSIQVVGLRKNFCKYCKYFIDQYKPPVQGKL